MSERAPAPTPARVLTWIAATAAGFLAAWAPALPAGCSPGGALDLLAGRGDVDQVASVWLRLADLARLGVGALALALLGYRRSAGRAVAVLGPLAAALLAAAWADLAWGGWPPPGGWQAPALVTFATALAALGAALAQRREPRALAGVLLLLLGGLGQQIARPAVELEALRSLERLALGDLTRSLAPLWVAAALVGLATTTRGALRTAAGVTGLALSAGGLWGLAAWALLRPLRRGWSAGWSLVPLALGAEALSAQVAGWGRLAPGIPGGLAAGLGLLVAGLLGLGRGGDADPTGS